ncbi:MAG: type IV pilus assembly protein PilM [Isosphaeraceae bacterium]|nr:type IV pilus assembly protein PilM [Isosphaeraceae bacterium]
MAKIQPVWALDIGQAALKALKLVPGETPDQVVAEAFDYIEHPKILSQPDADADSLIREALATFMDRNDLKGCKVAIAVPGQAGLVKFIKLPPVEKKRIPDIVKFEAKQQIPFDLNEVIWAYQQIGDEDEEEGGDDDFTMAEVGLFAMKRDQINRAILPYKIAGIEIDVVQMSPIALYNFIAWDQIKGSDVKGSVVLIDMGADHTDLIITDGTRIWQRNVPIGGNHFTRALTKELKLTFAKAEHLKKNATKAPDPKAVFTAMRGVFNDFASEINRSIGFYSSVNRMAKIAKIIGLGNAFKMPGLQKFLQQNVTGIEVEKLSSYQRMVGDEVTASPQFAENMLSFGVAYGLALQGLGKSPLRTNLLPPEIEQVRMIRAKKPWILAACALLMLGFTALFYGDYKALAKVDTEPFKKAVASAKSASTRGAGFKSEFDAAKAAWQAKFDEGKSLVLPDGDRAKWPTFLMTLNKYLPDPVKRWGLDPRVPKNQPIIDKLRVHVDRIAPVYRADVATEWFDSIPSNFKNLMHPYDRDNPPSGPGWIIQVVGHHYNPLPKPIDLKLPPDRRTAFGPVDYLQQIVLPGLQVPSFRQFGAHHVALAWMTTDKQWSKEKGSAGNQASNPAPLLARASAPAGGGGEGGEGGDMASMYMSGGAGMMGGMGGGFGGGKSGYGGAMDMEEMMGGGMMPGGMRGGFGGMMGDPNAAAKNMTYLTRTDFLIQFVWQPPTPDAPAPTYEEIVKALREAETSEKNKGAVKIPTEAELEAESIKRSKEVIEDVKKVGEAMTKAMQEAQKNAPAAPAAPATPGAAAPAAPATPAAPAAPGNP